MRLNESWRRGLILLVIFLLLVAAVFWLYAAGGWLELYTVPWEGREEAVFGVVAATATAILIGTLQWLRSKSPDKVIEEKDSDPVQPTHGETQVKHTPSVSVLAEQAEKLKVLRISLATNQRRLDELSSTYQAEHDLEKRVALQSEIQLLQTEVDAQTNEIHELTFGLEGHSPYKGLLYFSEEDERIFFGRNNLIRAILPKIVSDNGGNEESFLAVIGASGSGKSSVIRAGIVPKLRARDWPVVLINPTATPLRELSAKLCIHRAVEEAKSFEEALRNDTGVLLTFVRQSISDARRFVLVVDQFEELFTLCKNEDERTIFVNALVDFVKDDSTLLLITLRADFYGHISDYLELSELIVAHQVYVRKMTQEEIRQAVAGPAITLGYEFDDGLIDEIVRDCGISANDSEPGALPLLSHALLATWERRSGHRLTRNAYSATGRVQGAIAQTANATYDQFTNEEKKVARSIFIRLTEYGEGVQPTRRRISLDEIPSGETGQAVLQRLVRDRLVVVNKDSAEVAHEALIHEWPLLIRWLGENSSNNIIHEKLRDETSLWISSKRASKHLYEGFRLSEVVEYKKQSEIILADNEEEFIQASLRRQSRKRNLQILGITFAFAALIVGLGILLRINNDLNASRNEILSQSLAMQAQSFIETEPMLAALLSVEAGRRSESIAAASALNSVVPHLARLVKTIETHEGLNYVQWSQDESRILTVGNGNTIQFWDVASGMSGVSIPFKGYGSDVWWNEQLDQVMTLTRNFGSNGLAPWEATNVLDIWDATDGSLLYTLGQVAEASWSPNNHYLYIAKQDGQAEILYSLDGNLLHKVVIGAMINSAEWNENSTQLLVRTDNNDVLIWDVVEERIILEIAMNVGVYKSSWNNTGDRIHTYTSVVNEHFPEADRLQVWQAKDGTLLSEFDFQINSTDYVPLVWNSDESQILNVITDFVADTGV